jgi:TPP-dependent pyruvate/acetoin dehydrogenase alpha subunit
MSHSKDKSRNLSALERMLTIRRFEECLVHLFAQNVFHAHYHLYIGQEATGVAVMESLKKGDKLATTHRNHGHVLARGADPGRALAEILTRTTGLCNGYGGTLHLSDPDLGFMHTSGIVGGCISLATGAAFALKNEGGDNVAVAFFGDGSLEEGISYEAMNFAALWSLPIVYVCENNSKGAFGSVKGGFPTSVSAVKDIKRMPHLFDMPCEEVDGRNLDEVSAATGRLVEYARKRKGPAFLHAVTDRWAGSKPLWPELPTGDTDIARAWQTTPFTGEHADWYANHDPILIFVRKLMQAGETTRDDIVAIDHKVNEQMEKARKFAIESPIPSAETALAHVFA